MTACGSTVVLGDIGGHHSVLMRSLEGLGVDSTTLKMPADLVVVQLGDLVRVSDSPHLDSLSCVLTAERLMRVNPGQWVQLIGNHDAALLGGPRRATWRRPEADDDRDVEAAAVIRDWWQSGSCRMAQGLVTREFGAVLLTHGGLTRMRWQAIGAHQDPRVAAEHLNRDVSRPPEEVFSAGLLVDPDAGVGDPDVTWAEVGREFYEPWIFSGDMPFSQIHGHASPWNWQTNEWWPSVSEAVRSATQVQSAVRRTLTRASGHGGAEDRVLVSADWNLGEIPTDSHWPLLHLTGVSV